MRQDLLTILQLGSAFFAVFSAFNTQGFIEITVLRNLSHDPSTGLSDRSGYYSLAIIYFTFTLSNLFVPPIVHTLGSKWSQVVGALCYSIFLAAFLDLRASILYLFSALLGFGAALLWTANGVFLVENSREGKMERNSGVMWAMLQSSLLFGAAFLLFVVTHADLTSSYRTVYGVFTVLSLIGVLLLAALPTNASAPVAYSPMTDEEAILNPNDPEDEEVASYVSQPETETSWTQVFQNTFVLLRTKDMALLIPCFLYSGIELTFYSGVYTACLSATNLLTKGSDVIIPYNAFCMGIGQIAGGLVFGLCGMGDKFSRWRVVTSGVILHLIAFFLCFINLPNDSPLHNTSEPSIITPSLGLALFTGLLLGLGDSSLNTQIYSLIGALYQTQSSSAFSLFKFFQSMAACISFYYGSALLLHIQLYILAGSAVLTIICFTAVDRSEVQRE